MLVQREPFIEAIRTAVLSALDIAASEQFKTLPNFASISKPGVGATDGDLPYLFKTLDAHAENLAIRYGVTLVDYDPDEVARIDLRAMGNTMSYRGYIAKVVVMAEDNTLVAHYLKGNDNTIIGGASAETVAALRIEFAKWVDRVLADPALAP